MKSNSCLNLSLKPDSYLAVTQGQKRDLPKCIGCFRTLKMLKVNVEVVEGRMIMHHCTDFCRIETVAFTDKLERLILYNNFKTIILSTNTISIHFVTRGKNLNGVKEGKMRRI